MRGSDAYERWLDGARESDYSAHFNEMLQDLPLPRPIGVTPMDSVRAAIEKMNAHRVGCVLIGVEGLVSGIFTERDVMRRVSLAGPGVLNRPVADFMTREPVCLLGTDRVVHALNAMVDGGYRHVPVVDRRGWSIGVFGMRSFVAYITDLHPEPILNAPPPGQRYAAQREGA
jgi:signal-transduction protein with cAMP-binding, CBS, and nucleotidyltransferase domain